MNASINNHITTAIQQTVQENSTNMKFIFEQQIESIVQHLTTANQAVLQDLIKTTLDSKFNHKKKQRTISNTITTTPTSTPATKENQPSQNIHGTPPVAMFTKETPMDETDQSITTAYSTAVYDSVNKSKQE